MYMVDPPQVGHSRLTSISAGLSNFAVSVM
jgi:hypothetical protein